MPSYAVVGASRGIGLEYVRQLANPPDTSVFTIVRNPAGAAHLQAVAASLKNVHILAGDVVDYSTLETRRPGAVVFAIVRDPAGSSHLHAAVAGLKNVHIIPGDIAEYSTVERAAKQVSEITEGKPDYLIHLAAKMDAGTIFRGYGDYSNMEDLDNDFIPAFKVNSLGPVHSIIAFLPLLRVAPTKKIIVLGSGAGDLKSMTALGVANLCAYGMTKAAAHIATTKFAMQLKDEGFVVITLDPGLVNTGATTPLEMLKTMFLMTLKKETNIESKIQTPEVSVVAQLGVIDRLEPAHNGLYLSHMGGEYQAPGF